MVDEKQKRGPLGPLQARRLLESSCSEPPVTPKFDKRPQQFAGAASARLHIFPQT